MMVVEFLVSSVAWLLKNKNITYCDVRVILCSNVKKRVVNTIFKR